MAHLSKRLYMNKVLIGTTLYCALDLLAKNNDDMVEIYGINYIRDTESGGYFYEILDKTKFALFMLKHSEYIIKIYE